MAERAVSKRWAWLELWLPLVVISLDQTTKAIVRAKLQVHDSVEVIPGVLNLTHVRNTGAAFGLFNAADFPFKTVLISTVAMAGLIGVALYSASLPRNQLFARFGLALVIGGAAGNLIDRFVEGSVVDFVDVYWRSYHFWAFNVADSAITIGFVAMLLDLVGVNARVSKTA
jgi:signal peptidase II